MSGLKRELKACMVNGVFSRRQTIEIKKVMGYFRFTTTAMNQTNNNQFICKEKKLWSYAQIKQQQ